MKELHLNIVSPEKEVFNGEVKSVTLPGTSGVFSILPQHAPIVSSLQEGSQLHDNGWRRAYAGYSQRFCGPKQW